AVLSSHRANATRGLPPRVEAIRPDAAAENLDYTQRCNKIGDVLMKNGSLQNPTQKQLIILDKILKALNMNYMERLDHLRFFAAV
ncbi:acyltransferase, partial [Erwinia amylovora]|nr:acyltransferase [Erwinia amylovora]